MAGGVIKGVRLSVRGLRGGNRRSSGGMYASRGRAGTQWNRHLMEM